VPEARHHVALSSGGTDVPGHESERRQAERKHIFAVNGAAEFLEPLRQLFQDEHFNVTTTNYVPHTFDLIAALDPDLIIVDLAVGQRAGWDLLERLHAEAVTREIPVLVTSTDQRLLDRVKADVQRYGERRFVAKPMQLDELLGTVHEMIGSA
jgi:two-component system NtrC family sensor kinase